MTADTPRADSCPHCGAKQMIRSYVCGTTLPNNNGDCYVSELCREREARKKAKAEVEKFYKERRELSRELHMWEMGMYFKPKMQAKIDELKAEVERLKELVNESILEKSKLSIALVNCQANLRRAIDVARMLPVIPIPAISSRDITDTLYAELNQLKATLNPTTEDSSAHQL